MRPGAHHQLVQHVLGEDRRLPGLRLPVVLDRYLPGDDTECRVEAPHVLGRSPEPRDRQHRVAEVTHRHGVRAHRPCVRRPHPPGPCMRPCMPIHQRELGVARGPCRGEDGERLGRGALDLVVEDEPLVAPWVDAPLNPVPPALLDAPSEKSCLGGLLEHHVLTEAHPCLEGEERRRLALP